MRLSVVAWLVVLAAGCLPVTVPMRATYNDHAPAPARCLVIFLPGIGDSADSFEDEGFVETVRQSGLAIDVVGSDATLGYYTHNLMPGQLYTDVIAPARARRQYEKTWVMGVSFGGLGALITGRDYANEIDGVFAMAPYLGRDDLLDAIRAAGGLAQWRAPARAATNGDNYDWQLWRFLKEATAGRERSPALHVGWGKDDRLAAADQLLAANLPEQNVYLSPGGHTWKTWRNLLAQFLKRGPLARDCAPTR